MTVQVLKLLCASVAGLMLADVAAAQLGRNVSLFGRLIPNPYRYSGSWYYVAPDGAEYALVGAFGGTHIVRVDDSTSIHQVGFVVGHSSNWREITVLRSHAFVVTEGGGTSAGMQVISLAPLPDSVHLVTTYRTTFTTGHVIMRDISVDSPYVYVSGTSATGGVHILNVANPAAPAQIGVYNPGYYIHDAHIRGNRLYASAGGRGVDIVNITDKRNPVRIGNIRYTPLGYTHSVWTTEDERYLFIADETDGIAAQIWNIENLSRTFEVSRYSANLQSLVHNPYIKGRYAFIAHNTEGLRVVDIADPRVPVEVGFYDTWSGPSGGFNGLWSACPYLPSGKIIGGDRTGGLYIWRFNNAQAARVYGLITDRRTLLPIRGAHITLGGRTATSDSLGGYRIGDTASVSTVASLQVSATGFQPIVHTIVVNAGDSLTFNIALNPIGSAAVSESGPLQFSLEQNYPNPFNPVTTVRFSLAESRFVSLEVVDELGRRVVTLVNDQLPAGNHRRTFGAANLSSGTYYYQLKAGNFVATRKMAFVR